MSDLKHHFGSRLFGRQSELVDPHAQIGGHPTNRLETADLEIGIPMQSLKTSRKICLVLPGSQAGEQGCCKRRTRTGSWINWDTIARQPSCYTGPSRDPAKPVPTEPGKGRRLWHPPASAG